MRKLIFALLLILGCSLSVFAEKISWQMVEAQTLKNSPSVRAAKLTLDNARQMHKGTSLSPYLPKVSLNGKGIRWNSKDSQTSKDGEAPYNLEATIGFSLKPCAHYEEIKNCCIALKIAELDYKRSVSGVIFNSKKLYLDLIMANEEVKMAERTRERCIGNEILITLEHRSGKANTGQLEEKKARVLVAERSLKKAQKRVKEISVDLLVAMGRDDIETILEVDKQIVFPKKVIKKPDYNSLVTTTPEFLIAQYNFEKAKVSKMVAPSKWLPSVNFNGGYRPKVGSKDSRWGVNFKDGTWNAGISLSYDIFTGFRRCYDSKIDSNNFQAASLGFLEKTDSLKKKAEELYNELVDAYEDMETAKNNLESSKFRNKFAEKEYANGLLGYDEWCLADDEYVRAQENLLKSKKTVALKIAEWYNFTCDDLTKDKEE
ncbi:membrane protein [Endomicrobiia bacterium]|nr:membrane protein [Endomicrobiia bacterium]